MQPVTLENEIKARAASLGFAICGITTAEPPAGFSRYLDWLARQHHGGMAYLETAYHKEMRKDPAALFPDLRSIIILGLPYRLSDSLQIDQRERGIISGYAVEEDYHLRIPRMLQPLIDFLVESCTVSTRPRVFTDNAPILERELAQRAGLGWIGKNGCLISPKLGSGFVLAEIFTDIPLQPDATVDVDRCGSCTKCLDACPSGCIQPDRTVDSSQCLSYHSIENRKIIPHPMMERFSNQLFGCEICQVVCPWNRFAPPDQTFPIIPNSLGIEQMEAILKMDEAEFIRRFGTTPVSRVRLTGLKRNILIFFGNAGIAHSIETISQLLEFETDPVLQCTASWALGRINRK